MTFFSYKFWQLIRKIKEDDIIPWSSMLTIYLLLSIFPIIIILTALITRFSFYNPELLAYWTDLVPPNIYQTFRSISRELTMQQDSTVIPTATIITVWSASRGILAIIKALNKAYNIHENRGYIRLRVLAFYYTVGFITLIALALALVVFGNNLLSLILNWVTIPDPIQTLIGYMRYVVTVMFSLLFFISLYNVCPSEKTGIRKVLPGAVFASVGLIGISTVFSLYLDVFSDLSYLYGSLTGFIIVILWLFVVSVVIMVGGEINAVFFIDLPSSRK